MPLIYYNLTVLVIAGLYYGWRDLYHAKRERERVIRQRVAYMLWTAANQMA